MKADPEERFEALYWAHHQEMLAFIRRRTYTGDTDIGDAEDIVAEAFVVAWRRLGDVPDPARGWLFAVARNILRNHQRSQRRSMALRLKLTDEQPLATPDPASAIAGRADLVRAWNRLTTNEREVIALTAWDELSQDEAATVLGCTKTTYAVRLHRARRRMLHLLNRTTSGGDHG